MDLGKMLSKTEMKVVKGGRVVVACRVKCLTYYGVSGDLPVYYTAPVGECPTSGGFSGCQPGDTELSCTCSSVGNIGGAN
jgi:hypothetical protein